MRACVCALKGWINLQAANAFGCEEKLESSLARMHLQREKSPFRLWVHDVFRVLAQLWAQLIFSRATLLVSGCERERRVLSREHQTECTSLSVVPYALRAKNMLHLPWVRCARAATAAAATAAPFSPIQHLTFVGESFEALCWRGDLCSLFWAINYFYNSIPLEKDKSWRYLTPPRGCGN